MLLIVLFSWFLDKNTGRIPAGKGWPSLSHDTDRCLNTRINNYKFPVREYPKISLGT